MSDIDSLRDRLERRLLDMRQLSVESMTESDVRAKLIDPLFCSALGWPESQISREDYTTDGEYIDYKCGNPVCYFVIEAKRAAADFQFPNNTHFRYISIQTLASGDPALRDAINQAAKYCFDEGISYGVVTTGVQLLVFRAIRTDRPWRKGKALVFRSADEMLTHFTELWNLLAYPSVRARSLDHYFAPPDETPRHYRSVIASLQNPDERLVRNSLNSAMIPVIAAVFDDLIDDTQTKVLEACYVKSPEFQPVANEFILTIRDLPPKYLESQVQQLSVGDDGDVGFSKTIEDIRERRRRGAVLVLLGGVGAGKTTFLRQVRVKYCRDVISSSGAFYYIDFRGAPRTPPFEGFVYEAIRRQLDTDAVVQALMSEFAISKQSRLLYDPGVVSALFADEMETIEGLGRITGATQEQVSKQKLDRLTELAGNDEAVVKGMLRRIEKEGRFVLIALDNADQHELDYQLKIFLFAQNLASDTGANIICALREEKYYLASQKGAFNAFYTHKFHIPNPRVKDVLSNRLRYAIEHLDEILEGVDPKMVDDVNVFLNAVWAGGVGRFNTHGSSNVVRLLERTCVGNTRRALTMFRRFLRSGNTDVAKVLGIARENIARGKRVPYFVPFHEFTKSVMLDDRLHYREGETEDEILNVFGIANTIPTSHFTALRVLSYLMENSEVRNTSFGTGYVEWERIVEVYDSVVGDPRDVRFHLERLLFRSLVEADTGVIAPDGESALSHCRAVKATASGEYYLTYLCRAFAYLDLVWVDTPVADSATHQALRDLVGRRDFESRFERVELFLRYLGSEEEQELQAYPQLRKYGWAGPFIPKVREQVERESRVIRRRVNM
ncbi:MAG: hypothetical protein KF901_05010 [Myxococcales bacterium]|nr:hypothetical protein [Myxococcales bacterium]